MPSADQIDPQTRTPIRRARRRRFGLVFADVLTREDLAPLSKLVYAALCTFADAHDRDASPSVATLATGLGIARRSVYTALSELERAGVLTREAVMDGHGQRPNIYMLHDDAPPPAAPSAPSVAQQHRPPTDEGGGAPDAPPGGAPDAPGGVHQMHGGGAPGAPPGGAPDAHRTHTNEQRTASAGPPGRGASRLPTSANAARSAERPAAPPPLCAVCQHQHRPADPHVTRQPDSVAVKGAAAARAAIAASRAARMAPADG